MSFKEFRSYRSQGKYDIAVIGAGISGLYAAWRLIKDDPKRKIAIVERLDRTGGRLDTDIIKVADDEYVREEEGGMRFDYSMMELMNLNKALNLCKDIVPFPMSSEVGPDKINTNRFFVRGHNFTVAEADATGNMIWSELYDLKTEEQGLSPTALVTNAYKNVLFANGADYKPRQPKFWTKFRNKFTWKGKALNEWQLWGLLRDMNYSEECIQMLSQTIGFAGPFQSLANAGDAFQILADFPADPSYSTFKFGFSSLPNAIVKDLKKNHADNVHIFLSTNVDSVHKHRDGKFALNMTKAPDQLDSQHFIPDGRTKLLNADKMIVAVATKGMQNLFASSPALNRADDARKLWENINMAMGMKLMKINLYFDKPWWENGQTGREPVQFGPNFTDLPVNAVYPFYSLPEGTEPPPELLKASKSTPSIRDAAAALTIYCDFNNTNFWKGLQNIGPMFTSDLQQVQDDKKPQTLYSASRAVVDEAKKQLQALFGTNWVPEPVLTSYRLWNGENDFEYAYHQWQLNVDDREVRAYMSNPIDDVYFCNEAISDMQGWVNGSLRSTNLALAHFGLKPMDDDPCEAKKSKKVTAVAPAKVNMGLWGS